MSSPSEEAPPPLLEVTGLQVDFLNPGGVVHAVDDVNFTIRQGEFFGLAGESGSGKSTLAQALLRILPPPGVVAGGRVLWDGQTDVLSLEGRDLRRFRWAEVSLVFQSAMNSLNPVLTVEAQLRDVLLAHGRPAAELHDRIDDTLHLVGLDPVRKRDYPHQLSGGMRQRVVLAMALLLEPRLVIMDEPTTALDVVVQRDILDQLATLRARLGFAVLFITHDLPILFEMADRVAILYAGRLAEVGQASLLNDDPRHPYTRALLASVPSMTAPLQDLRGIQGSPPDLRALPRGCAFHPRCGQAEAVCHEVRPRLVTVAGRRAACHVEAPGD